MKYNYYIADVFTKQIFSGAQIAVFPKAEGLSKQQMQLAARELNLSETVFVFHPDKQTTNRVMRIFSPQSEIDFAGHPIIATAFVLASCGEIQLNGAITPMVFEQNTGPVNVNISAEDGKPSFVQFTRKVSSIIDRFTPSDEELASFLSIQPSEFDHKKYSARLVSCGFPYLIVPVWRYESVRNAKFNYAAWSQSIAPQTAAQEILLFSPKTPFADADFNARLLGPRIGIHDDPPVGSAMPAFASYLCSFEFMQKGTYTFTVDRGEQSNRRSVLNLEMDHKKESMLTIRVGGAAVMVVEGVMSIPE
ncbi:PhzF family phenazine biosynthesis protein [Candidatus Methylobacter oryzae]|uniref:PhzF family phenazine biosynthesis protein n=1 Tax=Candidatus Methylobacter oryzae TaxID=2497749 RepID=A0ABY3CB35_9GAMM|nr:PhzF family phenazine biosynthesis protein [Candidatus Methylobacter oryzae]TRW95889.1 PhzF family phenazine biosynthesis protein [Candidatus Methylobacter oryzae]